ncbi:hypothetical protein M2302_002214 [Micromonospora sp. A200]|uniref:hypothetical protein n=1 Tax=Micromonospora sp. A200 TaxID=2940568 RepID=UPI002474C142|nr:hypothetical protein [Micromonospora sp. A200]MDH6462039.1 hypothetical protein [Micromonospora sp. A200]
MHNPETPQSFTTADGLIHVCYDRDSFDFHIDLRPGFTRLQYAEVVDLVESWGLEFLDPEECEPNYLEDGTIRIWLTDPEAE